MKKRNRHDGAEKASGKRELCGAKKTDGSGTCGHTAGWGTSHPGRGCCKWHGGSTPTHVKKAQREELEEAVAIFALSREIEPTDALLEEVHRTAGLVHSLDLIIRSKTAEELLKQPDLVLWHRQERRLYVMVSRVAIAAGITERQVQVSEHQAAMFATALHGIIEDLGVADHPRLGKIVRHHLTLIDGGKAA